MELSIASTKTQARRKRVGSTLLAVLLTCVAAQAAPLQIQLVDQEFSTYTYSSRANRIPWPYEYEVVSNRITADLPVSDAISNPVWNWTDLAYTGPVRLEALAEADWSHVRSFTRQADGPEQWAVSAAMTQIRFTSLNAGLADFDFNFHFYGEKYFTQFIRLRDIALDQEIWSYGYSFQSGGSYRLERMLPAGTTWQETIPLLYIGGAQLQAQMNIETLLNTTSTYELTMLTTVDCNPPEIEDSRITWTVPAAIPEPSAWALVMVGLTVTLLPRHRLVGRR